MNRKFRQTIYVFLILSLLIHSAVVLTFVLKRTPPVVIKKAIEIEIMEPPKAPDKEAKKNKRSKANLIATDQIVEQQKQINNELDENTHLLSAFNQRVEKQTRAEKSGKFANTAKAGKQNAGQKEEKPKENKVADEKQQKPSEEPGEMPTLKDLAPKFSMEPGPKGQDSKDNNEASQTDDYLKDVNTGMQTLLSTREFVYYSYYARIKEAIRQHWEPDVREKVKIIYRQGRTIASAKDRVTQVLVTLNSKGELLKVEILSQSGVETLDNAAIDAFRAASPFPNPPKGMIEPDGTIKIRWDFVLEV